MKDCEDKEFAEEAWYFYSYKPARAIRPLLKELLPPKPENFAEPPRRGYYGWAVIEKRRGDTVVGVASLLFCYALRMPAK